MIEVKFYTRSGKLSHVLQAETAEIAFEALEAAKMEALAHPADTTCGCYNWNPTKQHTLEGFKAKLALCCNSAAEYSDNLFRAGICRGGVL